MKLPVCLAALGALAGATHAEDTVVYDLKRGVLGKGSPWSGEDAQLSLSPGPAGTLEFQLADLPAHEFLKLEAEVRIHSPFFRMNEVGPESEQRLQIALTGGRKLFDSSFATGGEEGQSFPDRFGGFVHPPNTGSEDDDNRYQIALVFPHAGEELALSFRWKQPGAENVVGMAIQINGLDLGGDGSDYTVTGLKLTALEAPGDPLGAPRAEKLFAAMGGENAGAAHRALNQLVPFGDGFLPFVRERFSTPPDVALMERIAVLAEGLRSDSFKDRTAAQAALGKLGAEAIAPITAYLAENENLTADVRNGLQVVKSRIEKNSAASPDQVLANRLRPALEMLDSDEARAVLAMLPAEKKVTLYTAPEDEDGVIEIGGGFNFEFNLGGDDDDE